MVNDVYIQIVFSIRILQFCFLLSSSSEDIVLLAAVADSAERAVENNITSSNSIPSSASKGITEQVFIQIYSDKTYEQALKKYILPKLNPNFQKTKTKQRQLDKVRVIPILSSLTRLKWNFQ